MKTGRILRLATFALAGFFVAIQVAWADQPDHARHSGVSILAYHRFGPTLADSMTVTNPVFQQHIDWLNSHGYRIIPLRTLVEALPKLGDAALGHAVVITVDDGHRTVYTELFPLILKYRFPVTLFIYPSAISNASYALTWEQISEMVASGLVDVQSTPSGTLISNRRKSG